MSSLLRGSWWFRRRSKYVRPWLFRKESSTKIKSLDKILIANRGEIACRVMRTCQEMGIKSVAVYSDADSQALHVRMADEAVRVGPPPATESYLDMEAIFKAIQDTGAQAVHPGYGFLSENRDFVRQLTERGVTFIGPHTHAIHVMGDKLESKRTAMAAKVNIVPGYDGVVRDADHAVELAQEIGFPVMLKASAGGGGKGMRIAWNEKETRDGFHLATEEAKTAVKDDRLLIEKFIDKPRHIEIQVLGDSHGNVVYLNERECSIQRRNQKVIEEAPSTFLDHETRQAMGEQAVALAKAVQYDSAGTVEFLVDSRKNFYFLEMNTRLQVEHPVTECITGIDIVREMINVAAGHPLSFSQQDVGINGWSLESRVYAEDPVRFLPSIGYLSTYIEPLGRPGLENVRVDTGIVEGTTISVYYDPMISKLITHGPTRKDALESMARALDNYCIKGVNHNIPVLRDIMEHPRFVAGDISTNFLSEVYPEGFKGRKLDDTEKEQLIAAACFMHLLREKTAGNFVGQKRKCPKTSNPSGFKLSVALEEEDFPVEVEEGEEGFAVSISGNRVDLSSDWHLGEPMMRANISGKEVTVHYEGRLGQLLYLRLCGNKYPVLVLNEKQSEFYQHVPKKSSEDQAHILRAPMPGVAKSILCKEGDEVEEGAAVVILEAMKMQNPLFSPMTGKIKKVHVEPNGSVAEDDVILEFEK